MTRSLENELWKSERHQQSRAGGLDRRGSVRQVGCRPFEVKHFLFLFNAELKGARGELQRRQWHPTPVLLPGKSHGRRSHGVTKSQTRLRNFTFTFMHWRRKWQPTPVFLPGESQGRGSLVGCRLWARTESDTTEATQQQQRGFRSNFLSVFHVSFSSTSSSYSPHHTAELIQRRRGTIRSMF